MNGSRTIERNAHRPDKLTAVEIRACLFSFLRDLEIPRGGAVLVHSAFRNLSRAGFSVDAFLQSLLDYVDDGTLAFPAMSWRLCNPQNPYFFELDTPAITGVLSERFRAAYAEQRSIHPTHSVSASGAFAKELVGEHHTGSTPCSDNSPWGKLAKLDFHIVLLGVDMDSCTLIHHAEECHAPELYLQDVMEKYICTTRAGEKLHVRTRRHRKLHRNFWKFREVLEARNLASHSQIGPTQALSFRASDLKHILSAAFEQDRKATIAKPGERSKLM